MEHCRNFVTGHHGKLWSVTPPLSHDRKKIAYDQGGGVLDTKTSPYDRGLIVGIEEKNSPAQGKMKMTLENIAYDQVGGH